VGDGEKDFGLGGKEKPCGSSELYCRGIKGSGKQRAVAAVVESLKSERTSVEKKKKKKAKKKDTRENTLIVLRGRPPPPQGKELSTTNPGEKGPF